VSGMSCALHETHTLVVASAALRTSCCPDSRCLHLPANRAHRPSSASQLAGCQTVGPKCEARDTLPHAAVREHVTQAKTRCVAHSRDHLKCVARWIYVDASARPCALGTELSTMVELTWRGSLVDASDVEGSGTGVWY
jgi:hypothetical protein